MKSNRWWKKLERTAACLPNKSSSGFARRLIYSPSKRVFAKRDPPKAGRASNPILPNFQNVYVGRDGVKKIELPISLLHSITIHWDTARFAEHLQKVKMLPHGKKVAYTDPYEY